jgi:hypothetical protein
LSLQDDCREKLRHHLCNSSLHYEKRSEGDLRNIAAYAVILKEEAFWDEAWDPDCGKLLAMVRAGVGEGGG